MKNLKTTNKMGIEYRRTKETTERKKQGNIPPFTSSTPVSHQRSRSGEIFNCHLFCSFLHGTYVVRD